MNKESEKPKQLTIDVVQAKMIKHWPKAVAIRRESNLEDWAI